jgi:ribA/ribD-fused uncharacterized protein
MNGRKLEYEMNDVIRDFSGEYEFLSNFYICVVPYRGVEYRSSEHAYQAAKTIDLVDHDFIAESLTPTIAKKRSKEILLREDWERVKESVMYNVVFAKFEHNLDIRQKLLDTGDAGLIEGNWWGDTYWGVCKNVGKNKLGKILMNVRWFWRCQ